MSTIEEIEEQVKQKKREIENLENNSEQKRNNEVNCQSNLNNEQKLLEGDLNSYDELDKDQDKNKDKYAVLNRLRSRHHFQNRKRLCICLLSITSSRLMCGPESTRILEEVDAAVFLWVLLMVADLSKMDRNTRKEIVEEMRNEAKILTYLKDRGYKHAPKLFYCGYWCAPIFFTIATQIILGHHKSSQDELTETEAKNLETAIKSLHELNVVHNDLKWDNVLFCDNQKVFIIDYGLAQLKDGPISIKDERYYDLD